MKARVFLGISSTMPRYAALLRGVSPMNCLMPDLKRALEAAGFTNVATVLSSGNAVFDAKAVTVERLEKQVEAAMEKHLGRVFVTIIRPVSALESLLATDPFLPFRPTATEKRVVSFLKTPSTAKLKFPLTLSKARIVALNGTEAFGLYEREDDGPVFMSLIEKTFGKDITTRTWDTMRKVAAK